MNTNVQDIVIIANALNGKVDFSAIEFDQCIMDEKYREQSVNNIVFVKKMYGVWFYTTKTAMEDAMRLAGKELPVLVGCSNSRNLYRIYIKF